MNNNTNNNKSFAEILHETYVNEVKRIEEEEIKAASTWLEVVVKPNLIEAAKNLKTSKSYAIPQTVNVNKVKALCCNKKNKLTFEIKNDDTIIFYW